MFMLKGEAGERQHRCHDLYLCDCCLYIVNFGLGLFSFNVPILKIKITFKELLSDLIKIQTKYWYKYLRMRWLIESNFLNFIFKNHLLKIWNIGWYIDFTWKVYFENQINASITMSEARQSLLSSVHLTVTAALEHW